MENEQKPLMRIPSVAEYCNCSVRNVWNWVKDGKLPVVRINKTVRVTPSDLDEFIKSHKEA